MFYKSIYVLIFGCAVLLTACAEPQTSGHYDAKLAKEGKLVLAGPFLDDGDKRGLYIFNVTTIEEAKAIVMTDPAVTAGVFTPEFTKYYGSAALMKINEIHGSIQKTKIE